MDARLATSLLVARTAKFLTKLNRSGGTAAPGLLSLYLDPNILKKLSKNLETTVLITGTNGKTTTSRIIGDFFEKENIDYIHNRHGSNLERGLVSAFISRSNLAGEGLAKTALFEVDEAVLPIVVRKVKPKVLVINNLFRDQLDRYGEVDHVRRLWENCLENLDESTILVLNADDPSVASLGLKTRSRVIFYGLDDVNHKLEQIPSALDSIKCPICFTDLKYQHYYLSHQGDYHCPNCNFKRPDLNIVAKHIKLEDSRSSFILEEIGNLTLDLETPLPGLYNIYNCLASYGTLRALDLSLDQFPLVIRDFKPAFGRTEKLEYEGKKITVALAKNPTGFNEIIRTFLHNESTVLIAINDLIADGRDVSWLWDVDFEKLKGRKHNFYISGLRAADMGLRLKYAHLKNYTVVEDLNEALQVSLDSLQPGQNLIIIPTYTAMMNLKKLFAHKGIGGQFWED